VNVTDDEYSPQRRTGVLLCGSGTAGAYQAGVLQALTEAGVKVDVVASHGAGVILALCAAIDGGGRLWGPDGPWARPGGLAGAYRWRAGLRLGAAGLLLALAVLASPVLVLAFAVGVYGLSLLAGLANMPDVSQQLVVAYGGMIEWLFSPPIIPTIVPRAVVLALLVVVVILLSAGLAAVRAERTRRRMRGAFWWKLIGAPLDPTEPATTMTNELWRLVRGASSEPRPAAGDIGRRYVDVLADNLGQPGFREVLVAVHDLDARRDLVGAVLRPQAREAFDVKRAAGDVRDAETVDLTGPQRELLLDLLVGSWRLPIATEPHPIEFPSESYWQGERHRLCDRPELVTRLVDEAMAVGVEQLIVVGAAPPSAVPHGMRPHPADLRSRIGEVVRSIETSALRDAEAEAVRELHAVFVVRPDHNPVGPFDFGGVYDEASDRHRGLPDLVRQGYEDAYRQFIEPMVASGEREPPD
jgi:hypothetical protein